MDWKIPGLFCYSTLNRFSILANSDKYIYVLFVNYLCIEHLFLSMEISGSGMLTRLFYVIRNFGEYCVVYIKNDGLDVDC